MGIISEIGDKASKIIDIEKKIESIISKFGGFTEWSKQV